MSDITVTQVSEDTVETLRANVAEAQGRAYGAERDYAIKLCSVLPALWYTVEHNDKGAEAKQVHTEKRALFAELKKINYSNPSTVWARVRKYGQEHVEGKPQTTEGATASESVATRNTRSLTLRLVEELSTLYKATKNAQSLSDKERDCQTHITSALIAMGVDVNTIE